MIVINLFGGPGVGKTTIAAGVFYRLKQQNRSVEFVTEYAKELTWEDRSIALQNQPSILGKQHARIWRLKDKVDIVVTDSPLLLSVVYNKNIWKTLPLLALELHQSYTSINYWIKRNDKIDYDPIGRNQKTSSEAKLIDSALLEALKLHNIPIISVEPQDSFARHTDRVALIMDNLEYTLDTFSSVD